MKRVVLRLLAILCLVTGAFADAPPPPVAPPFAVPTGSMSTLRDGHTVTLLSDGRVLVAGGFGLNTAEIYDPTTGTFTPTGNMNSVRAFHTATVLQNGTVLIAGGDDGNGAVNTAEIFDPGTGVFTPTTGSLATGRELHTATLLPNGLVLIAGGSDVNSNFLNSAELYDPNAGTFSPAGNMTAARAYHAATLLQDGRVLMTAGVGTGKVVLTSAEIYDSSTNAFSVTGSLTAGRIAHTATPMKNGKVLLAGGEDNNGSIATAEVFDPSTGTFAVTASMSTARSYHAAALLGDGRVLVIGGFGPAGYPVATSTTESYDPATGMFVQTGNLATARSAPAVLLLDGLVLVVGGSDQGTSFASAELMTPFLPTTGNMSNARYDAQGTQLDNGLVLVTGGHDLNGTLSTAELFNPSNGTFAATNGPMTSERYIHAAVLLNDGRVLLAGGFITPSTILSSAETFDPVTGLFTATSTSMSAARELPRATVLKDGRVLITGGYNGLYLNTAEIYDPVSDTFTATGSMSDGRYGHTATLLADGRVLVAGGENGNGTLDTAEIYDPGTGTFSPAGSMLEARALHTATLLNNGTVLITGPDATAEIFDPVSVTFTPTANNMTSPRLDHTATLLQEGRVLVVGGYYGDGGVTGSADLYDPATRMFTPIGALPVPLYANVELLLNNGQVLIAGGLNSSDALASAELYAPYSLVPSGLASIELSPSSAKVAVGYALPMLAQGTFADSHTETLQSLTWSSSNTSAVTTTNDDTNRGRAYGVAPGTANVTACAGTICGSTAVNVVSGASDLGLSVTVAPQTIPAGQTTTITYTIQVANNGPDPSGAPNVVVADTLPAGTTLVSMTSTVGSCAGTTCSLGLMAPSGVATITLTITANVPVGTLVNTASVSSDDYDPNPANDFVVTNVYASDCLSAAPQGYNSTWIGGSGSNWNTAANWSTGLVPSSEDSVFVCATAQHQPVIDGYAYAANVLVPTGASIDLANSSLHVYGSVSATGPIIDTGSEGQLVMIGTGTLQGSVTNLIVVAAVTQSGNTVVNGLFVLGDGEASSSFSLNGFAMVLNGQFIENGNTTLFMQNPADHFLVNGDVYFYGANNATSLTAGVLEVAGSFYVANSPNAFTATGTHLTRIIGPGYPTRNFSFSSSTSNQFQNLEFALSSGSISFNSNTIVVAGDLSVTGPGVVDRSQNSEFKVEGALTTSPGTSFNSDYIEAYGPVSIGGYFAPYEIYFYGTGQIFSGNIDAVYVYVYGDLTLQSDSDIGVDDGEMYVYGSFDLNGHTSHVSGYAFYTETDTNGDQFYPGLLFMKHDTDHLILDVDYAYFEGTSVDSNSNPSMTAGSLDIYGALYADYTGTAFLPTGTHLTRLVGTGGTYSGYQYIDVYNDGGSYLNAVQNLEIANFSSSGIELGNSLIVNGTLTKKAGAPSTIYSYYDPPSITAGTIDVNGLVLGTEFRDGTPLIVNGVKALDNVIFQSYLTSDVQLTVNDPGATTPYTFTGLQFLSLPCGDCGGLYIQANDTSDDANVLTINMVDAIPADGSSLTSTTGGAVVNWSQTGNLKADLGLAMYATPMAIAPGGTLEYYGTVTNNGSSAAEDVVFTNTIPAGSTISSASTSIGSCDTSSPPTITCPLGNMANGAAVQVYLYVTEPSTPGTVINTSTVTSSTADPNSGNNAASVSVTVANVVNDINLSMHSTPSVTPGGNLVYDLVVNNPGTYGVDATGVVIIQVLPAGFTFVSATNATCVGTSTLTCTVGTVPIGASVDVQVTATAGGTPGVTQSTAVVTANEPDPSTSDNQSQAQVVVVSLPYGVVERESLRSDGTEVGSAYTEIPSVSYTGRFVVFDAYDAYVPDDTDGDYDVYLRDNCRGAAPGCSTSTIRVSVSNDPNHPDPNGDSYSQAVSGNGRYVAFMSYATNLTADALNYDQNIFIRDTCAGTAPGTCTPATTLVSQSTDGVSGDDYSGDYGGPAISFTGRYVAFDSYASNLTPQYNDFYDQVFLRDTCLGAPSGCTPSTILISANLTNGAPREDSNHPSVTANGRYVTFEAYSYDAVLVTGGANDDYKHVFLRDTCIGATGPCTPNTIQLDVTPTGDQPQADGVFPSVSSTGRYVAFQSTSNRILPGLPGESSQVFVRDTCIGAPQGCTPKTYLASAAADGSPTNGNALLAEDSDYPPSAVISADGSRVVFFTSAHNLVPGVTPSYTQVYVRNTCLGIPAPCTPSTAIVEVNPSGQTGNGYVDYYAQISGDGTAVVFDSDATNLVTPAPTDSYTIYLAGTGLPAPQPVDHFAVTTSTTTPVQGTPFDITVTAEDANGNTIATYLGTIHFSLVNADTGATVPADYTFTGSDSGTHTFLSGMNLSVVGSQTINVNDVVTPAATGAATVIVQHRPTGDLAITIAAVPGAASTVVVTVTNNGPDNASNVMLTDNLDRFAFVSATPSQGPGCNFGAPSVMCPLGALAAGNSATVTVAVQAPDQGWASESFAAGSELYDPVPTNNLAQTSGRADGYNTNAGDNILVPVADADGDVATVNFTNVKTAGTTRISSQTAGMLPPPGYRFGTPPMVYDISTNANYAGSIVTALRFNPNSFHHPAKVRIFHLENGTWMDRTAHVNVGAATVSAMTVSLSPFIVVEPLNNVPVASAGNAQAVLGVGPSGAAVTLDGSASSDADGDTLSYRWSGPFPEGNGTVTGVHPSVTLPLGASTVTLVVNDSEADSTAATAKISVSDFAVAIANSTATLKRGQTATFTIAITPVYGNFDAAVSLGCPALPAGITCSFSPSTVTPGANGASTQLTIATAASASVRRSHQPLFAFWFGLLPFGLVLVTRRRRAWQVGLTLLLLAALAIGVVSCGGGGSSSGSVNTPSTPPASTVTVTINGAAGALQHSQTVTLTVTQ